MPSPAHNKEPVWFYPRDSKEDGVCYYLRDGRKQKHHELLPLTDHPEAHKGGEFAGMVFLHREPHGDRSGMMGDLVKDWYGPRSLVDEILSIQDVGGGYQSGLLYARGTTPPTEDPRIDVLGIQTIAGAGSTYSWLWVADPDTTSPGPDLIEVTLAAGNFTGDEVYINFSDLDTLTEIDGVELGIHKIARHIDATTVQVVMPYDSSVSPSGNLVGTPHEACYILDGYSDSESAPGVLSGLFHLRTFSYRLALPSITHPYDESLGLELTRESRLVPSSWMRLYQTQYPLAAEGTEEQSIGYQAVSKLIANRQKDGILGSPAEDGIEWDGWTKIQIPKILRDFSFPWGYAWGQKEGYLAYREDWALHEDTWGPASMGVTTRTLRRIVKRSAVDSTITTVMAGAGAASTFTFQPEVFSLTVASMNWWAGDNVWANANLQTYRIGPCLLENGASLSVGPITGPAGPASGAVGSSNVVTSGSTITLNHSNPVPWGSEVLWDITTTKARYGYWIIDFIFVTLPSNPAS